MKLFKILILILSLWVILGCTTYIPEPFVPYNVYNYPPPGLGGRNNEPTSLRCIDNSNIFVHCNEAWWWAGPNRGWVPTGGGYYPWPRQIWTNRVYELYNSQQLRDKPTPIVPYSY